MLLDKIEHLDGLLTEFPESLLNQLEAHMSTKDSQADFSSKRWKGRESLLTSSSGAQSKFVFRARGAKSSDDVRASSFTYGKTRQIVIVEVQPDPNDPDMEYRIITLEDLIGGKVSNKTSGRKGWYSKMWYFWRPGADREGRLSGNIWRVSKIGDGKDAPRKRRKKQVETRTHLDAEANLRDRSPSLGPLVVEETIEKNDAATSPISQQQDKVDRGTPPVKHEVDEAKRSSTEQVEDKPTDYTKCTLESLKAQPANSDGTTPVPELTAADKTPSSSVPKGLTYTPVPDPREIAKSQASNFEADANMSQNSPPDPFQPTRSPYIRGASAVSASTITVPVAFSSASVDLTLDEAVRNGLPLEIVRIHFVNQYNEIVNSQPFRECDTAEKLFNHACEAEIADNHTRLLELEYIPYGRSTRTIVDDESSFEKKVWAPLIEILRGVVKPEEVQIYVRKYR